MCVLVAQSCPTLCDPTNCSPPGFSVHGILQARILEWIAIPFSRVSSRPRNQTLVSCIAGRFFTVWTTGNKTMEMVIRPVAESDGGEGERDEQVEYTGVLETTLYEIIVEDTSLHIWPDPSAVATGLEKVSFHSNPKECSNYRTIALISHASNVMLKILQPGFNSMWTANFQMFKLDLEKAKEPEIRFPTSVGSKKKQENFRKISTSASLTTLKPLTVWITVNCGKFFKRWEYQTTWPTTWGICMQQ